MAWPWQQSKWRPVIAQAALWVVLVATVGVAALIDRKSGGSIPLGEPITYGRVKVAVPKGWAVKKSTSWRTLIPEMVLTARPVDQDGVGKDGRPGRTITVSQQPIDPSTSPKSYLAKWKEATGPFQPFNMAGQAGVRCATRGAIVLDGEALPAFDLSGSVVLPSGLAVTLDVQGFGRPGPDDDRLFTAVAKSIESIGR